MSKLPTKEELLKTVQDRSDFLKVKFPKDPKCKMCDNNVDRTMMGKDTACVYHRMLWDSFMYDAMDKYRDIKKVREEFVKWNNTLTKDKRDNIVADMAKSPLNWEC